MNFDLFISGPLIGTDSSIRCTSYRGAQHPVSILCSVCSTPYNAWVSTDWDTCEIELDDYPNTLVEAEPARGYFNDYDDYDHDYYEWLEQQERPHREIFRTLCQTLDNIEELCQLRVDEQQSKILRRMLLAQSITAMEIFFSDTLIPAAAASVEVQERLLKSKSIGIGEAQFRLSDAAGKPEFAKEKLVSYLRAVSFHDIAKVAKLFQVGLGVDILPREVELKKIETAIKQRHDCVHRNGKDRETGGELEISNTWLLSLTASLRNMLRAVDEKVEAKYAQ
ncbi:hypothetical protein [Rhodovulum sp. MB263]|uniref:hypothetical protein n=1 Tax=Rhodovulum sp. (strain MB263) TaxID=308754 RepID=UPI0012DB09F4|nr:hypothetical protein [Rhodovulum sp. MB263]